MPQVLRRERARGVHPQLHALLDSWAAEGTHDVVIAVNGGVRTDPALQSKLAAEGFSAATTLKLTPHGRAAAVDVWPASFLEHVPVANGGTAKRWSTWAELPDQVRAEFKAFGIFAEERGFKWGGRWIGKSYPNGDQPHVEIANWQRLPFPPPIYG
jgi:D-alanyl-D-alanine carboxypeptidase